MTPRPPRHSTSELATRLFELLQAHSRLPAGEACRLLLKTASVGETLARQIVATLVDGDVRFRLEPDGGISLEPDRQAPDRPLQSLTFTVFDLETTGGSPAGDRILEFGAIRVEDGAPGRAFSSLVNPGVPIPPFITGLTGIREDMVAGAPPFEALAPAISDFLADSVLVSHNLPFDLGFLNRALTRHGGYVVANPGLCTVRLGRRLLPQLPDRRLDTVAAYFGFSFEARHRALDDARVTARILLRFVELLGERGIRTLEGIERFMAREPERPSRRGITGPRRRRPPAVSAPASDES